MMNNNKHGVTMLEENGVSKLSNSTHHHHQGHWRGPDPRLADDSTWFEQTSRRRLPIITDSHHISRSMRAIRLQMRAVGIAAYSHSATGMVSASVLLPVRLLYLQGCVLEAIFSVLVALLNCYIFSHTIRLIWIFQRHFGEVLAQLL